MSKTPKKPAAKGKLDPLRDPVPEVRRVESTVALAQILGVHRQTIDDWRLKCMPTLSVTRNGTGEICTYDLKTVVEWRYSAGIAAGIEEVKGKAKGLPDSPEAQARARETADLELRTLRATTAQQEDKQALARIELLESQKAVSHNEDVLAIFMYHMALVKASLESLNNDLLQLLIDCGVHPDEAKRKLDDALARMVDALDEADPLKEPLEGHTDAPPEPPIDEPRPANGEPDQQAAQDGPQDEGLARADAAGGSPPAGTGPEGS